MRALVTGVAGFIGSHLSEKLIGMGINVIGIDSFTDFYPQKIKEYNLRKLSYQPGFSLISGSLLQLNLSQFLEGTDYIFHLAAQAGVRSSWGKNFAFYSENNVLATQRLLEVSKEFKIKKFIFASSSSVYGDTEDLPMREEGKVRPISPYGVTKLACEHLCDLYYKNYNVPTVSLRYFTVFGPRQRPDMAFNIFFRAVLESKEIIVYGDGEQTRDFTFVSDIVDGTIAVINNKAEGEIFNLGGGSRISLKKILAIIEKIVKSNLKVKNIESQKGDVKNTFADTSKACKVLGFFPKVKIEEGLVQEFEWIKEAKEKNIF